MTDVIAIAVVDDVMQGAVSPLNCEEEVYAQLLAVIALIRDSWPIERDKGTYAQYLAHDCWDLAELLTNVANEAQRVSNES